MFIPLARGGTHFYTHPSPRAPPHTAIAPSQLFHSLSLLAGVAAIVTAINPGEYVTEVTMIVARIRNFRKQSSLANNKTRLFTLTDVYLRIAAAPVGWKFTMARCTSIVIIELIVGATILQSKLTSRPASVIIKRNVIVSSRAIDFATLSAIAKPDTSLINIYQYY